MHLQAAAIGATLLLRGEKVNVGGVEKRKNEQSMSKSLLIYSLMLKQNGNKYECAFTKHLAPLLSDTNVRYRS